ncbi:MAG: aminoglycoside phosphotransferase family protein [Patescibacteria group bacterium]
MHRPIPNNSKSLFPNISDWSKAFIRYKKNYSLESGPIPKRLFNLGEGIFKEFLQEDKEQVLLHGDLHNDNILLSQRGWLVIDPKGLIGEKEFELGAYLRNPLYDIPKGNNYKEVEKRRIAQFSEELGFEKERIKKWALACAIISLLWFLEDENNVQEIYIRNAELIDEIRFG